jgi:hypothetical protein
VKNKLVGWVLALSGIGICLIGLAYAALFLFILIFPPCGSGLLAHQAARWLPVLLLLAAGGIYYLLACAGITAWRSIATRIILLLECVALLVVVFASFQGNADYSFLLVPGSLGFSGLGILLFRFGRKYSIQ